MPKSLPRYAGRLDALHRAFANDFAGIVSKLNLEPGKTVVDVGCGDGFFTLLLAANGSHAIGLDNSEAYLAAARANERGSANVHFLFGDVRSLPFDDRSVDVVWSAHSMHSYPNIQQCLREFQRILKPNGLLAILESDNVHSVMLSWPPDLELSVRKAEHFEIGDEDSYIGTYFPRFAMQLLSDAGYQGFAAEYFFLHRAGPASAPLAEFVELYLKDLLERTAPLLTEKMQLKLATLAASGSDKFLARQQTFFFGSLQVLALARAPRD